MESWKTTSAMLKILSQGFHKILVCIFTRCRIRDMYFRSLTNFSGNIKPRMELNLNRANRVEATRMVTRLWGQIPCSHTGSETLWSRVWRWRHAARSPELRATAQSSGLRGPTGQDQRGEHDGEIPESRCSPKNSRRREAETAEASTAQRARRGRLGHSALPLTAAGARRDHRQRGRGRRGSLDGAGDEEVADCRSLAVGKTLTTASSMDKVKRGKVREMRKGVVKVS